jgi:hypothetical protein
VVAWLPPAPEPPEKEEAAEAPPPKAVITPNTEFPPGEVLLAPPAPTVTVIAEPTETGMLP